MCRLLVVMDSTSFPIAAELEPFAAMARTSKEFQGDGWGCVWWDGSAWQRYRTVTPIWEDRYDRFGETTVLVAHARSAFRNEGIVVDNNMPFIEGDLAFAFNGELRGVRIAEAGRIGAEKLFGFLMKSGAGTGAAALARGLDVVTQRTRYVRAMNLVLARGPSVLVGTQFGEDPEYFTMHQCRTGTRRTISSAPLANQRGWEPIPNGTVLALE